MAPPATDGGSIRLSTESLEQLLARLGPDSETAGREYEAVRRKLIDYFDRRGVPSADALADETLDRVARKLGQREDIQSVRAYCYGVARHVHMEWRRERATQAKTLAEVAHRVAPRDTNLVEARVACLEQCLRDLPAESQDFILQYYAGEGNVHLVGRRGQAESLSVSTGGLRMRAYRIRVRYHDLRGKAHEADFEGDRAELLQHEIDHLDGVLTVDRPHGLDPFCLREEWNRSYAAAGRYGEPELRSVPYAAMML